AAGTSDETRCLSVDMASFLATVLPLVQLLLPAPVPLGEGIDQGTISRVLGAYAVDMQGCYEDALQKNPKLHGVVALRLRVEEDGKVSKAESTGMTTLPSPEAVACVVGFAEKARFDEQANAVTVSYSIEFEPTKDDGH